MVVCSAYKCTNRSDRNKKPGLSFHRFPKDNLLKKEWAKAVRRLNWEPGKNSYLCSDHFCPEFLNRTFASGRTELRENAVPTIFPSYPKHLQTPKKKGRTKHLMKPLVIPTKFDCQLDQTTAYLAKKKSVVENKRQRSQTIEGISPEDPLVETAENELNTCKDMVDMSRDPFRPEEIWLKAEEIIEFEDETADYTHDPLNHGQVSIKKEERSKVDQTNTLLPSSEIKNEEVFIKSEEIFLDGLDSNESPQFSDEITVETVGIKTEDLLPDNQNEDMLPTNSDSYSFQETMSTDLSLNDEKSQNAKTKHILLNKDGIMKPFISSYLDHNLVDIVNILRCTMAKHTKDDHFSCSFCDFKAIKLSSIKRHIKTKHTEEKPISCPYCNYTAVKISFVKKHIVAEHTKQRHFACSKCDFSSAKLWSIKEHFKTKHAK